jgi:hypothetical protein
MGKFMVLYAVSLMLLSAPVRAQDPLQQEAVEQAKISFESYWVWNEAAESWYLAYEIPVNPYTTILGQTEPVQRYIRAREVGFRVNVYQLTPADGLNGYEWYGTVTFTAQLLRVYDVAQGWFGWMNQSALETYTVEKRNGIWRIVQLIRNAAPHGANVRQPTLAELPNDAEGPRRTPPLPAHPVSPCQPWERQTPDGGCMQWRAPYGGAQTPSPGTQNRPPGCGLTCKSDGSVDARFCDEIVTHIIQQNLCVEGPTTSGYYSRMSDVGYYYCLQKRDRGNVDPVAIQEQWTETWRPFSSAMEKELDRFAVQAAARSLCP